VPDLICDRPKEQSSYFVYAAWRMISEACTLVLADMLYADGLIKNGVAESGVDPRIYPLFKMIKSIQLPHGEANLSKEEKISFIKKLLEANVCYALLGDDSKWQALLTPPSEHAPSEAASEKLNAYCQHFGKFFIGDNAWTKANYENMQKNGHLIDDWVRLVGKETFRKSAIPLLSDVMGSLAKKGIDCSNYSLVVNAVFESVFEQKIAPQLRHERVMFEEDATIQSKAFRRFLIGQCSLFSGYPRLPNLETLQQDVYRRLASDAPFSNEEQEHYRNQLAKFINGLFGLGLMSLAEAKNAKDCRPVFPPVYISYPAMQKQYGTIAACVQENIINYADNFKQNDARDKRNPYVKVIKGITFIDSIALEDVIDTTKSVDDFLRQKMINAGVLFWDEQQQIVKKPVVAIAAIGGLSVCLSEPLPEGTIRLHMGKTVSDLIAIDDLREAMQETMGMQSAYSYQNPKSKSPLDLFNLTIRHGHHSIAHGAYLGVSILGLSKKAELEFTSQRDLIHGARLTSARAACQDNPCLTAMSEEGAKTSKEALTLIRGVIQSFKKEGAVLDWREERNSIFPLSAAQALGLNGSLRNFQKLVEGMNDNGKEKEYRNILSLLNDSLHALMPTLYKKGNEDKLIAPEEKVANKVMALGLFKAQPVAKLPEKKALLLLGAPSIGKSTQLELIKETFKNVFCVSTGQLLRDLAARVKKGETQFSQAEKEAIPSLAKMEAGLLADDDAVYQLLMAYLSKGGQGHQAYLACDLLILDGVIKQTSNLTAFNRALDRFNQTQENHPFSIKNVIYLQAPQKTLLERQRLRQLNSQREDDALPKYKRRLDNFIAQVDSLIAHYREEGSALLSIIDASNSKDETFALLSQALRLIQNEAPEKCARFKQAGVSCFL
jgi:adenylate kinase family enzyme